MSTVRWFGQKHPAPIYDECPQEVAPVGSDCRYCKEPIRSSDDGFYDSGNSVFHRCCFLRMIFGSISHQEGMCRCFHEEVEDAVVTTLSRREEAEGAVVFYENNHRAKSRGCHEEQ